MDYVLKIFLFLADCIYMRAIKPRFSEVDMAGVRRFGTVHLMEVEVGNLRAFFLGRTPLVVYDGWELFVTSDPATRHIETLVGRYVATLGDALPRVKQVTPEALRKLVS